MIDGGCTIELNMSKRTDPGALRQFVIILAIAAPAWAQHTELAANGDGSVLYVASYSVLRDATVVTHAERRLYRIGPDGPQLFAQRESVPNDAPSPIDGVIRVQVSDDGSRVAFTEIDVCVTMNPCVAGSLAQIRGAQSIQLGPGSVLMSRNGRWALRAPPSGVPPLFGDLIDLDTSQHTSISYDHMTTFGVMSDGSLFVYQNGSGFGFWQADRLTPIAAPADIHIDPIALSGNGRILVYSESVFRLVALDTASGHTTILFDRFPQTPRFVGISDDGRSVVLGDGLPGRALLVDTNTSMTRSLTLPDGETATAGAMSGDGNLAFIATSTGRILRFEVANGVSTTLIPPTPDAGHRNGFSPGSLVHLHGFLPGSASTLQGRILLDGQPVPVVYTNTSEVAIQVPWEQHTGDVPFRIDVPSDSPFISNELVTVSPLLPAFAPFGLGGIFIELVKVDFSALLTSPPQPAEIVHTYMTGLGPVRGNPQTGMPAPVDVVMPIMGTISCTLTPQQSAIKTLFAGLAPGMTGIYQVTLEWPAEVIRQPIGALSCDITSGADSASVGGMLPFGPFAP